MDRTTAAQNFVSTAIAVIADYPDEVNVTSSIDERGVLLQVHANQSDLARVIGKEGRTINALREFLRALGKKDDAHYSIKVVDNA